MGKLEDNVLDFVKSYTEVKLNSFEKEVIRDNIKHFYEKQETKFFKHNGLIMRNAKREGRKFKSSIYPFLEERGLLPVAVTIPPSKVKFYGLEHAIINHTETLNLHAGGKSVFNKEDIKSHFNTKYISMPLEDLSDSFKTNYSKIKLAEVTLESKRRDLLKTIKEDGLGGVKTEIGTLKVTDNFELDVNKIFDYVSGKKELYARQASVSGPGKDLYEIFILPDNKKATLPKTMKFSNGLVLENIISSTVLEKSIYTNKTTFNKSLKEGYKAFPFEIEMDPMEFFRTCDVSFGKVDQLVENGLIDTRELDEFIEKDSSKNVEFFEVMTEASSEKRREIFDKKLLRRAQNFNYAPQNSNPFDNIELTSFSF